MKNEVNFFIREILEVFYFLSAFIQKQSSRGVLRKRSNVVEEIRRSNYGKL